MRTVLHDAWHTDSEDPVAVPADAIARLARRARLSSWWNQSLTALALLGTAAWGAFQFTQGASLLVRVMLALPFFLIAGACLLEFARYRARAAQNWSHTVDFLRSELSRSRDEYRRLAGWRGFAFLLGVMWLTIATRIVADGPAVAFAKRGFAEGLGFVIVVPVICSALVFVFWRMHLRRAAAVKQLELDSVERVVGSTEASR